MRANILGTAGLLALATLAAPAQERVIECRAAAGEDRAAMARRVASQVAEMPEGTGRYRIEMHGGTRRLTAAAQRALPARRTEAGPAAPIVVLDPASDADTEIAMTIQAALESRGIEIRATRNLDKSAGLGESGMPRWQEPAEAYLRESGAPEEIDGDAGLYAKWLGAEALVRLQSTGLAAPVILFSPEGEYTAASEAMAEQIQRQLPGAILVACAECVSGADTAEVVVDLGASAAEPAGKMAAASALTSGIKTLAADAPRSAAKGDVTSPAPGATLAGSSVTIQWTAGTDATNYWLMVGTWLGGNTLYSQDQGTLTSAPVSGLPTDGRLIYVRLWSYINSTWQSSDYTYRAFSSGGTVPVKAQMASPVNGAKLPGASVAFQWSAGVAVSRYYLMVGLWPGGSTLYDGDQGENRQVTVPGLPVDGRTLSVRLWSYIDGSWQFADYQYEAAGTYTPVKAAMTSPAAGSTLPGTSATFQWSAGSGVLRYYLFVGTWLGGNDLYSQDLVTSQSATVANLPANGSLLYVRLWSYINGNWQYEDSTYTASGTAPTPVKAVMTAPAPNSTLASGTVTFQWTAGSAVQRYYLFVGTSVGNNDIAASDQALNVSATLTGLPVNGKVLFVRLWSYINSGWQYSDYSYRAAGQ